MAETFNDRLEKLAQRRIDEAIAAEVDKMKGGMLPDYAAYKRASGVIAGLEQAKVMLDEALTECKKN